MLTSRELREFRVSGRYEGALAARRSLVDRLTHRKRRCTKIGDSGSVNQLMNEVDRLRDSLSSSFARLRARRHCMGEYYRALAVPRRP